RAERLPVRDGHVVVLFFRRDSKSMRAVNVDRHDARCKLVINGSAAWTKSNSRDPVGGFRCDINVIGSILGEQFNGDEEKNRDQDARSHPEMISIRKSKQTVRINNETRGHSCALGFDAEFVCLLLFSAVT